jgi:hypothetical protein
MHLDFYDIFVFVLACAAHWSWLMKVEEDKANDNYLEFEIKEYHRKNKMELIFRFIGGVAMLSIVDEVFLAIAEKFSPELLDIGLLNYGKSFLSGLLGFWLIIVIMKKYKGD